MDVVNAQMRAGVSATSAQGLEIEQLIVQHQQLNREAAERVATDRETVIEERRVAAETARHAQRVDDLVNHYTQLNAALSEGGTNMDVVNAQMRAGVSATSAQGQEIEQLVVRHQQLNREASERLATDRATVAEERRLAAETARHAQRTDELVNHYTQLNTAMRAGNVNMGVLNAQMRAGVSAASAQGQQIEQLVLEHQRLSAASTGATGSMRNFRGIMQNVGWQTQDTIVQLQMGTSAFVVLSQQGSQMASAFGPTGAIVGAVIALAGVVGGTLFASLMNASDATETLEEAQESLNELLEASTASVGDYAGSLIDLAKIDAGLANLKMTQGIVAAEKAIKATAESLDDLLEGAEKAVMVEYNLDLTQLENAMQFVSGNAAEIITHYIYLEEQLDITAEQAERLAKAQDKFTQSGDMTDFRNELVSLNETYGKGNEKLNEFLGSMTDSVIQVLEYQASIGKLNVGLADMTTLFEKSNKSTKTQKDVAADLIAKWTGLNATYGKSKEFLAEYNIIQKLTKSGQLDQLPVLKALLDSYVGLKDAKLDLIDATAREVELSKIEAGQDLGVDKYAGELAKYKATKLKLSYLSAEFSAAALKTGEDDTATQQRINNAREAEETRHVAAMKKIDSAGKADKKQKDVAADLIVKWKTLNETYGKSDAALAEYNITQQLTKSGQLNQLPVIKALTDHYAGLKDATLDAAIAAEDAATRESSLSKIESGFGVTVNDPYAAELKLFTDNNIEMAKLSVEYDADDIASHQRLNNAKEAEEKRHTAAMKQIDTTLLQSQMMTYSAFMGQVGGVMGQLAGLAQEGTAEAEALFYMTQAIALATTIVNTEVAAGKALTYVEDFTLAQTLSSQAAVRALGYASAGVIAGTTIAGAFDRGGVIPQDQYGIVSEYGDELVNGLLVRGAKGGTRVTSREDTANIINEGNQSDVTGGMTIVQNIYVTGNGDRALINAMKTAADKGAKQAYAMVAQDFKNGRGIRSLLKRSARV